MKKNFMETDDIKQGGNYIHVGPLVIEFCKRDGKSQICVYIQKTGEKIAETELSEHGIKDHMDVIGENMPQIYKIYMEKSQSGLSKSQPNKNQFTDVINYSNPVHQSRLNKEKQRIRQVVDFFEKKGKPAPENLLFPKEGDFYHNPLISHQERQNLHQEVLADKAREKQFATRAQSKTLTPKPFSTPSIDPRMGYGGYLLPKRVTKSLESNEKLKQFIDKTKSKRELEHYSPNTDLKEIDPKFQGSGVDARARRSTAHPHSFYYIAGTEPEHIVASQARSKYVVEIPEEASIYDISEDPMGYADQVIQNNNGAFNMDMMHELIKQGGHHGFMASKHPNKELRNVVALYHSQPVKKEIKLR
jgi:hypothetical protein